MSLELRPFDRTDRDVTRLNAALRLYEELILEEARNPREQIIYWIDHNRMKSGNRLHCFSINSGKTVVGYFQYSYYSEENIVFIEYFCLSRKEKRGMFQNDVVNAIRDHFASTYEPGFIIVLESTHLKTESGWLPDKKKNTYYEFLGFRKVQFDYRYPVLQAYGEKSYPADLMVCLPHGQTDITSSELRMVLRCLYFGHYLRWDKPFLSSDQYQEREKLIDDLYMTQIDAISGNKFFPTIGTRRNSSLIRFEKCLPSIKILAGDIFSNPLPKLAVITLFLLMIRTFLGNDWLFVPFTLTTFAAWCIVENTESSRKLFGVILSRLTLFRPNHYCI